jgi:hypothetical protein
VLIAFPKGTSHREGGSAAEPVYQGRPHGDRKNQSLFPCARTVPRGVARIAPQRHNSVMRTLAMLLVAAGLLFGVYQYYLKKMPTTDQGTAPTQAISLTGVRADLLQIAQAERSYVALNGHCASLDDLLSSNSLAMARSQRDGYSYAVDCSGGSFTVTAQHAPAPAGSPIRYPTLGIDQTMQVHEGN